MFEHLPHALRDVSASFIFLAEMAVILTGNGWRKLEGL